MQEPPFPLDLRLTVGFIVDRDGRTNGVRFSMGIDGRLAAHQLHGPLTPAWFSRGPTHCLRRFQRSNCGCKGVSLSCPRVVARKVPPLLSGVTKVARLFPVGEKCLGVSAVWLGVNRSYPLPYAAPPFSCGLSLSRFSRSGSQNGERVSRSNWPASSARGDDGLNELDFQTALHVLVQALVRKPACVIELPGTELVYVASVVPQNLLRGFGVSGLGRMQYGSGTDCSVTR